MNLMAIRMIALCAALLSSGFAAMPAGATSVLPLSLTQIVADAQNVVHVRCTGNAAQPDAAVGVATVTTFVVLDRAKGTSGATFALRQAGGTLNGLTVHYPVPRFEVGEEYVLFVPATSNLGFASPVGLSQGVFTVTPSATGKTVGNGRDFGEMLVGTSRSSLSPGAAAQLALPPAQRSRMDLSDFMDLVRKEAAPR
jgi:hypothetical protein